ncbi:MAG: ABC transporter permease subunit [Clostridiales bacterium]|nr:ABC transporter permease subunit [Clostridiales bacterium]
MAKISINKTTVKRMVLNVFYPLLALAIVLAVWAIAAKAYDNKLVLPAPDTVLVALFSLGKSGGFWQSVGTTLLRTLICFVWSFALALLFATLAGLFNPLHRVLAPIVTILRAAPTVTVILLLYAFMANVTLAKVVGFLIAFPIMYSAFYGAIVGVDKDLLKMAKLYKVRPIDRIRFIYLPSIANCLFDTNKATLSLTLKVIIASEILTNVSLSIGGKFQAAYAAPEINYLFAWTLIAIIFSFVLEAVVAILKKIWEVARCRT